MRIDECITQVRETGRLNDNDTDWTSARIRQKLTDILHKEFTQRVTTARSGFWLKIADTAITSGRTRYRLPYRATAIESIGVVDSQGMSQGARLYEIQGDQVVFATAPDAGLVLRVYYYLRPSKLVQEQTIGVVTAKDEDALTVTVDSVPLDRVTGASILSGDRVDIVHPNGTHELAVVNMTMSLSSTTFTFPSGADLTDVETGDYVRAADQTDWPCLQDDYASALCDLTAAFICRAQGRLTRAKDIEIAVNGTEQDPGPLRRFEDLIQPRVKDASPAIVPRVGILRGSGRRRWAPATT